MDLKIKDVAELLNVSETTIRRWLSENKIPAYRLNHQYRFSRTEIETWVMSQKLGKNIAPTTPTKKATPTNAQHGVKQFSLYRAINKGGVLYDIPGDTKEEIIRGSMRKVSKTLNLDAEGLSELLLEREKLQSTGLGHGIALPHTRDYLLPTHQDAVTIVFPHKPIPYDALDGKPVHSLFFLFACEDKRHLHLLAKIAHLCSLPTTINLLQSRPTREMLLEYVKEWESTLPKHYEL